MSGLWLKFLALLSMMVDHTGMALFPQIQSLRLVGRLAFPLYGFLLAEGAAHTENSNRYLGRRLIWLVEMCSFIRKRRMYSSPYFWDWPLAKS